MADYSAARAVLEDDKAKLIQQLGDLGATENRFAILHLFFRPRDLRFDRYVLRGGAQRRSPPAHLSCRHGRGLPELRDVAIHDGVLVNTGIDHLEDIFAGQVFIGFYDFYRFESLLFQIGINSEGTAGEYNLT